MASVKVAVRVRPFNERELSMESKCIIKMEDKKTIIMNQKVNENPSFLGDGGNSVREKNKTFTYDYSYWSFDAKDNHFASQEQVFQDLGKGVVDCAFEGYNACVLTYGQTGSGKTFSMMGRPGTKNEGLIPRICKALFDNMKNDAHRDHNFRVEVSYLEIYNERVRDLLRVTTKLQHNLKVREHPTEGPYVEDLSKHLVMNYDDIEEIMERGNDNRTTAATNMNDVSSRSHAIFTIKFVQAKMIGNIPSETVSKIHLVDLAGSERADSSGAVGLRLKEGGNINKSLLTLINVISTLADLSSDDNRNRKLYIPYRDSTLTWLLKDSLGGNSKTVILATISPADINYGETLSTLRYANRAKSIINKPTINEDQNVKLIRELKGEILRLKQIISNNGYLISEPHIDESRKLVEVTDKVNEMTQQWQCKWKEFHELFNDDENSEIALIRKEKGSLSIVSRKLPYLIGFTDNMSVNSGLNFYLIKQGKTLIGCENADIILNNNNQNNINHDVVVINQEHCYLVNTNFNVTLYPINNSKCLVNGKLINEATVLTSGSLIILGNSYVFRFVNPFELEQLKLNDNDNNESCNNGYLVNLFLKQNEIEAKFKENSNFDSEIDKFKIQLCVEKANYLNHLNDFENKVNEQRKQIDQLSKQNDWANNEIRLLNNDIKLKQIELKEKSDVFEREKLEYLVEKDKFEEQKLLLECFKDLNDTQMKSLRQLLTALKEVKNLDNLIIAQIKKEKYLIEKEILDLNGEREVHLTNLNIIREKIMNNKQLRETKDNINKQNDIEKDLLNEINNLKQDIDNEKLDLEQLKQYINNKKVNFLSENKTLEEAIDAENETIMRANEQFIKLKAEKESIYSLIELEIENARINMDKELITIKTQIQNKKANLIKQENDLFKILNEHLYENQEEKDVIENELKQFEIEKQQLDNEMENVKLKEANMKESIMNEFNGLNELKQRDAEEIIEEEERIKTLCDNSLNNLEKQAKKKQEDINSHEIKLNDLNDNLNKSNTVLNELLSQLEVYETERLFEESKIFDSEIKFNKEYKAKIANLNASIINIERNYQTKLDENFTSKENIKQRICSLIGERKGVRLFYADLNDKLREIEQKYALLRAKLSVSNANYDLFYNTYSNDNNIEQSMSKNDAETLFLNQIDYNNNNNNNHQQPQQQRQQEIKNNDYEDSVSSTFTTASANKDNKFPLLRLQPKTDNPPQTQKQDEQKQQQLYKNTTRHSTSSSISSSEFNSNGNFVGTTNTSICSPNSLTCASDINYYESVDIPKLNIKPSVIYRLGIELDFLYYILNSKSTFDEHHEYAIQIRVDQEKWIIYRRYNKLRELHQKMSQSYPILKRLAFPNRKLIFNRGEKFLNERKMQLEHYLRCFLELLINDSNCPLNEYAISTTANVSNLITNSSTSNAIAASLSSSSINNLTNNHKTNSISYNNRLTKYKLCIFCPFFQQNDTDLIMSSKENYYKYTYLKSNMEGGHNNNLIY